MTRPFLLALLLISPPMLRAQDVGMDQIQDDCSGTSHHLFAELDAGKILILEFAMVPACSPCIDAGEMIGTIMDAYAISHPDRLKWYVWGYNDVYTCDEMELWASSHALTPSAIFNNGAAMVAYYGGMFMPTIVVLAGSDHLVMLNAHGLIPSTQDHIETAIEEALTVGVNDDPTRTTAAAFWPVPSTGIVHVNAGDKLKGEVQIRVIDVAGMVVRDLRTSVYGGSLAIDLSDLAAGPYVIELDAEDLVVRNHVVLDR